MIDPLAIEEAAMDLYERFSEAPRATPADFDDTFGHWLAGFTDGEGAFTICRVTTRKGKAAGTSVRTWPNCRYEITLRGDDVDTLIAIRDTLGFGSLYVKKPSAGMRPGAKVAAMFAVHRIDDCLRIVEIFTRYPLRAKKRVQFNVWATAVEEMAKGRDREDAVIDECRAVLAELRKFVEPSSLSQASAGNPSALKHRRNYGTPPLCRCGCGAPTKLLTTALSVPHPANPNYCSNLRGHGRRPHAL